MSSRLRLWNCRLKKLVILKKHTQSETILLVSLHFCLHVAAFKIYFLLWYNMAITYNHCGVTDSVPHVSDETHRNTQEEGSASVSYHCSCVHERRIKMPIQRKIPPTNTYSSHMETCVRMQAHTHSSTLLLREVNSSLTSSCIMWVKCSTEVAKYIATVTVLKWGDITQVSSDLKVKAICDTIGDCLCSIADLFDEIRIH